MASVGIPDLIRVLNWRRTTPVTSAWRIRAGQGWPRRRWSDEEKGRIVAEATASTSRASAPPGTRTLMAARPCSPVPIPPIPQAQRPASHRPAARIVADSRITPSWIRGQRNLPPSNRLANRHSPCRPRRSVSLCRRASNERRRSRPRTDRPSNAPSPAQQVRSSLCGSPRASSLQEPGSAPAE